MQMYKQMLRRCLSALLALTLLIAMIPNSALPVFSVEDEAGDYASNIGNAARFNEVDWSDFIVATKPFAYDGSAMEDENLIGMDQIDDDLVVVISDYYHETETCSLWYKIEAAPGSTLPAALKGRKDSADGVRHLSPRARCRSRQTHSRWRCTPSRHSPRGPPGRCSSCLQH